MIRFILPIFVLFMSLDSSCFASAQWRCKRCKQYVWVEDSDWRGNYYCPGCGTKMGEE